MPAKRGRPPLSPPISDADAQRQNEADRKIRLECLKLSVEMRTGTTKAEGLIKNAEELVQYANTGKVEER